MDQPGKIDQKRNGKAAGREARVERKTGETNIRIKLALDGDGSSEIVTGVGFFDHMLTQVARHGLLHLTVRAEGDLHIDDHHTVEDVGIALGTALKEAVGDKAGITRYGHSLLPMDEALVLCALDFSGRGFLAFELSFESPKIGTFDSELVLEFFRAVAMNAGLTLHLKQLAGANAHHIAEAAFKAFGRALEMATRRDARIAGVPSSKGLL
ncbi:MAG TPA: imidazoleglycerol-phosphate dehydratase HisB [Capsulimonadaceae bacterium]|nr:imidazoleglycerol-phosphate dehydratase HisB [Capsulimonadaceae bacterium]